MKSNAVMPSVRDGILNAINGEPIKMGQKNKVNSKAEFDISKCKAQDMLIEQFCKCLMDNPYLHQCEYYISYGGGFFCKHPNRAEIIRNTNKKIYENT